ncbi:MAG: hypothetical protein C0410_06335 [Anaerolinea sp.]|nr:hypothetical protein [Anaerolinea sp.]
MRKHQKVTFIDLLLIEIMVVVWELPIFIWLLILSIKNQKQNLIDFIYFFCYLFEYAKTTH